MSDETKDGLWKKLGLIKEGMNRVRTLAAEHQWEKARELLRRQEQDCRQFARWIELQYRRPFEPDELTQQCCKTLVELKELTDELQQSFGQRREELIESLSQLNEQDRANRQYQGLKPEISLKGSSANKAHQANGTGSARPNGLSGMWSPRRLALYS